MHAKRPPSPNIASGKFSATASWPASNSAAKSGSVPISDFLCAEIALVIEIDGDTHASADAQAYDKRRTALLEAEGYRICRFGNDDVMTNIDGVAAAIVACANAPSPSHRVAAGPSLSPEGRGF